MGGRWHLEAVVSAVVFVIDGLPPGPRQRRITVRYPGETIATTQALFLFLHLECRTSCTLSYIHLINPDVNAEYKVELTVI